MFPCLGTTEWRHETRDDGRTPNDGRAWRGRGDVGFVEIVQFMKVGIMVINMGIFW